MSVPDFQACLRPLLQFLEDGQEHRLSEASNALVLHFGLSPEDRAELLPSGRQAKFANRVGWAGTYLKKAGLIQSAGRARLRITPEGRQLLATEQSDLRVADLLKYQSFYEFHRGAAAPVDSTATDSLDQTPQTPEERMQASYEVYRGALVQELVEKTQACTPAFFERLVLDVLVAMGYGGSLRDAAKAVGRSGDGGIDGIIKEDRLGLDEIYIQAKRWKANVGRPDVQAFSGSLDMHQARRGIMITTSDYTSDARDYVAKISKKIVLIGGDQLAQLMVDYGVGVAAYQEYKLSRLDQDYFSEE